MDNSCRGANLDGVPGDEVIVGGREIAGLARGPAYQGVRVGRIIQIYPGCFKPGFSGDEVCDSG